MAGNAYEVARAEIAVRERPSAMFMTSSILREACQSYALSAWQATVGFLLLVLAAAFASSARAELSAEELAKLAQNPVANLISVPFQNNTNFNYGPLDGTQNILNI